MTAQTGKGTPYVEDTDALADYPATSQQIATHLDTRVPKAMASGVATVPSNGTLAVSFPAGTFTATPRVVATVVASSMPSSVASAYVGGITANGFTIRVNSSGAVGGAPATVEWIALQMDA